MTRARTFAGIAALLVWGVAGCSGDDPDAPSASDTSTAAGAAEAEPSAGTVAEPSDAGNAGSGDSAAPTAADLPVIATRSGTNDEGAEIEVTLNSVIAGEKTMTVTWTARNAGDGDWRIADYFFAGSIYEGETALEFARAAGDADGVAVLDADAGLRYLPARDDEGVCVCSAELAQVTLPPGGAAILEAVYQAVPADVTEVDVSMPNVGTFADAPVTR